MSQLARALAEARVWRSWRSVLDQHEWGQVEFLDLPEFEQRYALLLINQLRRLAEGAERGDDQDRAGVSRALARLARLGIARRDVWRALVDPRVGGDARRASGEVPTSREAGLMGLLGPEDPI